MSSEVKVEMGLRGGRTCLEACHYNSVKNLKTRFKWPNCSVKRENVRDAKLIQTIDLRDKRNNLEEEFSKTFELCEVSGTL